MIVNPEVGVTLMSTDEARLYVTMRHKAWPNGVPVKVFVLPDEDPLHRAFANAVLGMFPYQLRRVWDRQLFSGTGQAPITVATEEEMVRRVATTPGAMGYVDSVPADAPVRFAGSALIWPESRLCSSRYSPGLARSHLAADDADWGAFWDQLQGERLQVHGFASLTGVKTSANRFYGDSPNGTLDAAEVGLNASYQLNSRILFAGQVLSRMAGDMYDGTPALDYALVDLTLAETDSHSLGLRLGRLKNPIGLYNETRDVPFTRPSIFLPQVVYFDKVRNLMSRPTVPCSMVISPPVMVVIPSPWVVDRR